MACEKVEKKRLAPRGGFMGEYTGDVKDGLPHGTGEFFSNETNQYILDYKYVGEWQDGKTHGKGTQTWGNDMKYEGEFKNGFFDGYGVRTWPSGGTPVVATFKDGGKFEGEHKENKEHGKGKHTKEDGTYFEGEYDDGKAVKGVIKYANGEKYTGEVQNIGPAQGLPRRNGKGKMEYENGEIWEGNWQNGIREGEGELQKSDGTKVRGIWETDDLKEALDEA